MLSSRPTCTSLGSKSNWPRGGSRRGRATVWDAYRGVPSDVADTEEGVRGEDGALLHPNMISVEPQRSPFFGSHVCEQACGPSGTQIGVPIHTSGHVKRGWREDGAIYKTIPLVHRLAGVGFWVVVGRFSMVAAHDIGLSGDERRCEDSTAGARREDMMMKKDEMVCDEV